MLLSSMFVIFNKEITLIRMDKLENNSTHMCEKIAYVHVLTELLESTFIKIT